MKNLIVSLCLATATISFSASAGTHDVRISTAPDRVRTPLEVGMKRIGTIAQRSVSEIPGETNWRLGCEVLDRDYVDFEEYKEFVAPLGIKRVRLQGGWAKCEKVRGQYDFSWLDSQVDYLNSRGIECCIETSYGNPIYNGGGTADLAAGFPTSEEGLAGWDRWVDALTRHFAGRVRVWLMWNEPDIRARDGSGKKTPEMIAAFNVRTARIVKKNIPDAEIAGLSLASISPEQFERCLIALGEDVNMFRSFIYHGYAPAPESSYEAVEKLKELCAKYAPHAVMWQGENGCPSEMANKFALKNIPWTEYSQAKWDMRRMLGDLGHDVWSSVFTICDFNHTGREINLKGLLRANEEKEVVAIKRAYYAVQNVVSVFDSSVKRVVDSSWDKGFGTRDRTIVTYEYVKDSGEPVFVFWKAMSDDKTWARPGDSFETRPMTFRYTGKALKNPVWVDLMTGRVYKFPKENQLISEKSIRFVDVPVYDSPCILTERSAIKFRRK